MVLQPIVRRSVADEVFDQLSGEIVRGELGPGTALPSERRLCEIFGVNRGAVREALQRLAQAGLIAVRHGGATRVLDFRQDGGLDLLARLLYRRDGSVDLGVARSALEMRESLAPEIARRCALRATPELVAELEEVAAGIGADTELPALQELDLRFWDVLVRGSANIAYRLAYNTLRRAYDPIRGLLAAVMADELRDQAGHARVVEAVRGGDGEAARDAAAALVAHGNRRMLTALESWEQGA